MLVLENELDALLDDSVVVTPPAVSIWLMYPIAAEVVQEQVALDKFVLHDADTPYPALREYDLESNVLTELKLAFVRLVFTRENQ